MKRTELNFRQIHMDFHTSPYIEDVGIDFDPETFANILLEAKVNSITCFARCHHGYFYYNSKMFKEKIHPNLKNVNLLKEQIEACKKVGIRVPIYTPIQWDYLMAQEHPEWVCKNEDGSTNQDPYKAGFYDFMCVNTPYVDYIKAHIKELIETFDVVDGLFLDIVKIRECSCRYCQEGMLEKGYQPHIAEDRKKYQQEIMDKFKIEMSEYIRFLCKDATIFYNAGHIGVNIRPVVDAYSHLELESLPSGGWGYLHFPITVRYARNMGLDCVAQTGKFHTEWGDFHSFKNQKALEFECFNMLALNAKCMIGDQLHPRGKISQPVYDLIGSVYTQVEKKEGWCIGAKAVVDIGVMTTEEFLDANQELVTGEMQGITRMLQEGGHQFDIIDSSFTFDHYKVIVMPDFICVNEWLNKKLEDYIAKGGKVIASFESCLSSDKITIGFKSLGITLKEEQSRDIITGKLVRGDVHHEHPYVDYIIPKGEIGKGLPETEHAMYLRGLEIKASTGKILTSQIAPYFDRNYKHFCSHKQTPSSNKSTYDAVVKNGNTIYFAHPIFKTYYEYAPKWCKTIFLNALSMLLEEPILRHNGPSTVLSTVNEQSDLGRYVIHFLHYIPERRGKSIDIIEDVIPLYNLEVSLKLEKKARAAKLVPENKVLDIYETDGRVRFVIPKIEGHQMIEVEYDEALEQA